MVYFSRCQDILHGVQKMKTLSNHLHTPLPAMGLSSPPAPPRAMARDQSDPSPILCLVILEISAQLLLSQGLQMPQLPNQHFGVLRTSQYHIPSYLVYIDVYVSSVKSDFHSRLTPLMAVFPWQQHLVPMIVAYFIKMWMNETVYTSCWSHVIMLKNRSACVTLWLNPLMCFITDSETLHDTLGAPLRPPPLPFSSSHASLPPPDTFLPLCLCICSSHCFEKISPTLAQLMALLCSGWGSRHSFRRGICWKTNLKWSTLPLFLCHSTLLPFIAFTKAWHYVKY